MNNFSIAVGKLVKGQIVKMELKILRVFNLLGKVTPLEFQQT